MEKNTPQNNELLSEDSNANRAAIFQHIFEKLPEIERLKSEEEIVIIKEAEQRAATVLLLYGVPSEVIQPEHLHVIPQSAWPGGHAFMKQDTGEIILVEQRDPALFASEVVHEMFHAKGKNTLPLPLTEAIVEKLTNQAMNLHEPDLVGAQVFNGTYTYPEYRKIFDALINKVFEKGGASRLDIFAFFAKAHATGDMSHLSFLDDQFGAGTVEHLLQVSDNATELEQFIHTQLH